MCKGQQVSAGLWKFTIVTSASEKINNIAEIFVIRWNPGKNEGAMARVQCKSEDNGSMSGSIGEEGCLMSTGLSFWMSLSVVGVVKGSNSQRGGPNIETAPAGSYIL